MLKVAIIGTGNISPAHIEAYLRFRDVCEIVALCDIYPEKADAKKALFNIDGARVFPSHKQLIKELGDSLDLVSVCTPPFTHSDIAVDFLRAGINVIVEKPMASSLAECDRMLEAENESGKTLAVIAQNRFTDPYWRLKAILDSGLIGRVLHAEIDSYWWRGHCYYDLWWRGAWATEGGGCTLNHAVHHIDMLGWMLGTPEKVTAVLSNAAHDNAEVEDISIAAMQYPGGTLAQVTSSVIHHGEEQAVIIQGERARVSAPFRVYASTSRDNGFPIRNESLEEEIRAFNDSIPPLKYTGHAAEIDDVMRAIMTGTRPFIDGHSGRRTVEIITSIYKSGFEGHTVSLPLERDDPFYTTDGIMKNVRHFYEKSASVKSFADDKITVGGR